MITLIIPFRNRSAKRLQRNLDSLVIQTKQEFKVLLIDYGSHKDCSKEIRAFISHYDFVEYHYENTSLLPWNRAHALNIGVKKCDTPYFFPVDVDLIFDKCFVEILYQCIEQNKITTFKVAFLKKKNKEWHDPEKMKIEKISPNTALGMTFFNKNAFENVGGYNEKYIYWGGEDNDIVTQFKNKGYTHSFYSKKVKLYHQWHPRYEMQKETFPMGIKSFLLNSDIQNIFQQDRKRGEVLNYKNEDFKHHEILPNRFKMIWDIGNIIKMSEKGELIAFKIGPVKNKNRFKQGKQFLLVKTLNNFLKNKNLQMEWKYDEGIYLNYEVRDEILNYSISNLSRFDLLGLIVNEKNVNMYIKKLEE